MYNCQMKVFFSYFFIFGGFSQNADIFLLPPTKKRREVHKADERILKHEDGRFSGKEFIEGEGWRNISQTQRFPPIFTSL